VRVYAPDGGVRVIDFESEARNAQRALHEVELATARKDRDVRVAPRCTNPIVHPSALPDETRRPGSLRRS
jgi:hypothetical protein